MYKHAESFHEGEEVEFRMGIISKNFGKPTRRLITEAVHIGNLQSEKAMNCKQEWTYVKLNKVRTG